MAAAPETLSTYQTPIRSFLPIQQDSPPWCGTAECVQESTGAIDVSAHLREIATKRHRLYCIACTIPYARQHFHLRIAGVLPARNKMVADLCPVDPPVYRLIQVPSAFNLHMPNYGMEALRILSPKREDSYTSHSVAF